MLLLGVVIGWLAKPAPPAAPPPEPVAAPPPPTEPVVERKTEAAPTLPPERDPGPPPADSPFLADSILATFTERDNEAAYRRAVSFLAQGDAQGGLRGIVRLEAASQGKAWREPALVLVIEGAITGREARLVDFENPFFDLNLNNFEEFNNSRESSSR